ncbi:hypothetical protein [Leifsonia sp. C5G2]|jgi:hypothetical protein|uniref:hypothetical protein n=1 Tax=Leifsonia sp. C5G2 TaxID=2735269 RepID=UPI0015846CDD|nr:hypothetical protein [Leifsonia sp. C5G2]NUU08626.1 hypothetical protein [Leifsonia sp. C5G2]
MAVLENIESGRKADLSISQLLNIASGLGVPVSMLLAPMARPEAELDLPNLSGHFDGMTAAEFDCWLSATPLSSYRPRLAAERGDIDVLNSLRELGTLRRELERLGVVLGVQSASGDPDFAGSNDEVRERIGRLTQEVGRVVELLASAGISGGSASAS